MTGTKDVGQQAKVGHRRWLVVGLGALALVASATLFWTSGWAVDWSTCEDVVADSIELLSCTTTRWNAPAVIGSLLLLAAAVTLMIVGLRRTRRA